MYRIKNGLILLGIGISGFLMLQFSIPCLFKTITSYPCPACGMTRAFISILNGNILESFSYNILGVPLFVFFLFAIGSLLYGIFTNQDFFYQKMLLWFTKNFRIILLFFIVSWIVNLYRGI